MSYVEQTLSADEQYLHRANFNWTASLGPFLWFVLALIPLFWAINAQILRGIDLGSTAVIFGLALLPLLLGISVLALHIVNLATTEIAVTTSRFVFKTGLISRQTKEVSLNKIEEVDLRQSFWGRIFGYGFLTVRGTGVGVIELPDIDAPIELRRTIESAKAALRNPGKIQDSDFAQEVENEPDSKNDDLAASLDHRLLKVDKKGGPPINLR